MSRQVGLEWFLEWFFFFFLFFFFFFFRCLLLSFVPWLTVPQQGSRSRQFVKIATDPLVREKRTRRASHQEELIQDEEDVELFEEEELFFSGRILLRKQATILVYLFRSLQCC
jgi:hypothetical protein